ncbi:MAG: HAMP domain-containing histidine kinase, partial [Clostridia bacterium]|nr:HAMP domain-containing histidine kinase [Clostridia bacterium]
ELITNVTHDLKTPLTSLINYSGLLDRKAEAGELGDEESVQYIGVIHDQSEKLKHLIEDLLEASKASAGNVQLHPMPLNLTELVNQAIAEFAPEMEKNGNEILFTDADGQPFTQEHFVYADGQQTYRVLSNLLSNAQKYSAPGTRIYASVSDGPATTLFELKNTSAEPLNISAEELMQRFVRGDRSRGETEGHGLGLSIARDLTALMGGTLSLDIDGDLFKATVALPKEKLN